MSSPFLLSCIVSIVCVCMCLIFTSDAAVTSLSGWLIKGILPVSIFQLSPKRIRQGSKHSEVKYFFQCTLTLVGTKKCISQSYKECCLLEHTKFILQMKRSENTVKQDLIRSKFLFLRSLCSSLVLSGQDLLSVTPLLPLLPPSVTLYRLLSVVCNEFLQSSPSFYYICHKTLTFALHSLLHVFKLPQSTL